MEKDKTAIFEIGASDVPFIGANQVTAKGSAIFPENGSTKVLEVTSWQWFNDPKTGKQKPMLTVKDEKGNVYLRVIGASMSSAFAKHEIQHPDELKGMFIKLEKYDTGSKGSFKWGLKLVSIAKDTKLL